MSSSGLDAVRMSHNIHTNTREPQRKTVSPLFLFMRGKTSTQIQSAEIESSINAVSFCFITPQFSPSPFFVEAPTLTPTLYVVA